MTIRHKQMMNDKMVIDTTGPQGNAYALLGLAQNFARQLELDWKQIEAEMTSGDYDNLLNTFDKYFGDFVVLEV